MKIEVELPVDLFDAQFSEEAFAPRARELLILELVRVKRLHEHEAQTLLDIDRHELVRRMEAAGITPTEKEFATIRSELQNAIASKRKGAAPARKKR
ncbi:MAG: hypothetical protein ACREVG_10230 [Burkholderiales bacterium]